VKDVCFHLVIIAEKACRHQGAFCCTLRRIARDPYSILGIERSASPDDVKKAYRRLSKEWHPDKHKGDKDAESKFKEINEAYETLNDPEKKRMYDQFGRTSGQPGGGAGGFDFSGFQGGMGDMGDLGDLFENFFGGRGGGARRPTRGQDRTVAVELELKDVLDKKTVQFKLSRVRSCGTCEGSGAAKGAKVVTCKQCGGTGQVTRVANSIFGQVQQRSVCNECHGAGTIPETPCPECKGEGRTQQTETVSVDVPAGIDDGQQLRLQGQGDAGQRGQQAGDLYVTVRVRADKRFEREGADLRSSVKVPVVDAVLGTELDVETIQGTVTVTLPAGTQPGQVLRLKGKGVPELNRGRHGDHYVEVVIEVPTKLSKQERKILEEWKAARA
jgi:molecular chaperone DnaJ